MALYVRTVFNRLGRLRQPLIAPILLRSKHTGKKNKSEEDYEESIDVPLYKEDLPEIVLQNREKHLPERGQVSPFKGNNRKCVLCAYKIEPDYKNIRLLSQFVSGFSGVVYGKHITGLCKKRQEQVEKEISKSRRAGLMPYTYKVPHFQSDPELFNPTKPLRPHPYF